jgi:hypothetical protein
VSVAGCCPKTRGCRRKKVCALVQDVLKDDDFVATYLHDGVPERKVLYEDPELGSCILAHVNHDARKSKPHGHGPTRLIRIEGRNVEKIHRRP